MRRPIVMLVVALVAVGSACGSSSKSASNEPTSAAPIAASTTTSTMYVRGTTYTSTTFVVPFTVTVQTALVSPPSPESSNLVSWDAVGSQDNKVRFLVPVETYRPGSTTPEAPPADYPAYVEGQTKDGAEITNVTDITVGGKPATLMDVTRTITASHPDGALNGSWGCPVRGADQSDGCFGVQDDVLARLAVVEVGDKALLMWARTSKAHPDQAFFDMFERMLTTVQFR